MDVTKPFNLQAWVEENRHLLKPPVGNQEIYIDNEDFIVMVVGGPNGRKDYHCQDGEELFYQLEGEITLKIHTHPDDDADETPPDVHLKPGDMYLLGPNIPHSPQRPANTVGLVIERRRREGEIDKLMWFCENCDHLLHQANFAMSDIVNELPVVLNSFMDSEELRTCSNCGTVMQPA